MLQPVASSNVVAIAVDCWNSLSIPSGVTCRPLKRVFVVRYSNVVHSSNFLQMHREAPSLFYFCSRLLPASLCMQYDDHIAPSTVLANSQVQGHQALQENIAQLFVGVGV